MDMKMLDDDDLTCPRVELTSDGEYAFFFYAGLSKMFLTKFELEAALIEINRLNNEEWQWLPDTEEKTADSAGTMKDVDYCVACGSAGGSHSLNYLAPGWDKLVANPQYPKLTIVERQKDEALECTCTCGFIWFRPTMRQMEIARGKIVTPA